jgi:hypothetical protein
VPHFVGDHGVGGVAVVLVVRREVVVGVVGVEGGDGRRRHHPHADAFEPAGVDVAGVEQRRLGVGGVQAPGVDM